MARRSSNAATRPELSSIPQEEQERLRERAKETAKTSKRETYKPPEVKLPEEGETFDYDGNEAEVIEVFKDAAKETHYRILVEPAQIREMSRARFELEMRRMKREAEAKAAIPSVLKTVTDADPNFDVKSVDQWVVAAEAAASREDTKAAVLQSFRFKPVPPEGPLPHPELRGLVSDLLVAEGQLIQAEEAHGIGSKQALEATHRVNQIDLNLRRRAMDIAHRNAALLADIPGHVVDESRIIAAINEAAGITVILGAELNGVKSLEELDAELSKVEQAQELLKKEKNAPAWNEEILDGKQKALKTVQEVWKNDPDAGKKLAKEAQSSTSDKEVRNSREYALILLNYSETKPEDRADFVEDVKDRLQLADEQGISEAFPELIAAMDLFYDDLAAIAEKKAKEQKKAEDTFFSTTDNELVASQSLDITSQGLAEYKRIYEETKAKLDEAYQERAAATAAGTDVLRKGDVMQTEDLEEIRALLNFSWDDVTRVSEKPSLLKRMYLGVTGRQDDAALKREQMIRNLLQAQDKLMKHSKEDYLRKSESAREARRRIARQAPKAISAGLGAPRQSETTFSRSSRSSEQEAETTMLDDEGQLILPEGMQSNAYKRAQNIEAGRTKLKRAGDIAKTNELLKALKEKDAQYRDSIVDFMDLMNYDEEARRYEENPIDQSQESLGRETRSDKAYKQLQEQIAPRFDKQAQMAKERQAFQRIMARVNEAPNRETILKKLKAAGVESFDDLVIAAKDKKKFHKAWTAYENAARLDT